VHPRLGGSSAGSLTRHLQVQLVGAVVVLLGVLDLVVELDLHDVVLLLGAVLDVSALRLVLLLGLHLDALEFVVHGRDDVLQVLAVLLVRLVHLAPLGLELGLGQAQVLAELAVERLNAELLQVEQRVDGLHVPPERRQVLVLGVFQILVQHLDLRVPPVDLALMVLGQDLDVGPQVLNAGLAQELPPRRVDLGRVLPRVLLLPQHPHPRLDPPLLRVSPEPLPGLQAVLLRLHLPLPLPLPLPLRTEIGGRVASARPGARGGVVWAGGRRGVPPPPPRSPGTEPRKWGDEPPPLPPWLISAAE